jgi:hypothetical protein
VFLDIINELLYMVLFTGSNCVDQDLRDTCAALSRIIIAGQTLVRAKQSLENHLSDKYSVGLEDFVGSFLRSSSIPSLLVSPKSGEISCLLHTRNHLPDAPPGKPSVDRGGQDFEFTKANADFLSKHRGKASALFLAAGIKFDHNKFVARRIYFSLDSLIPEEFLRGYAVDELATISAPIPVPVPASTPVPAPVPIPVPVPAPHSEINLHHFIQFGCKITPQCFRPRDDFV